MLCVMHTHTTNNGHRDEDTQTHSHTHSNQTQAKSLLSVCALSFDRYEMVGLNKCRTISALVLVPCKNLHLNHRTIELTVSHRQSHWVSHERVWDARTLFLGDKCQSTDSAEVFLFGRRSSSPSHRCSLSKLKERKKKICEIQCLLSFLVFHEVWLVCSILNIRFAANNTTLAVSPFAFRNRKIETNWFRQNQCDGH